MKKCIMIITMFFTVICSSYIYGTATISVSNSNVTVGTPVTVTVSISDEAAWDLKLTSKYKVEQMVGDTGTGYNDFKSYSFKYTPSEAGNVTFELSGNVTDENVNPEFISISKNVTINAPVVVEEPTTTSTPITPTTPSITISSNTNLKKLVANYEGLSPNFNPNVTNYSLILPSTAENVEFTVATEDIYSKYWISGDDSLTLGDNTVIVTVTAQDGSKKVYTIIVTKAEDPNKANAYLSNIVVDGIELSPEFVSETLEYDLGNVESDVEKFTLFAYAQSENANVEIIGNDKLIEGENLIKIIVTAEDNITTKEYILKVNKKIKEEENALVNIYGEVDNIDDNYKKNSILNDIGVYIRYHALTLSLFAFCLFEFAQILYFYKKYYKLYIAEKKQEKTSEKIEKEIGEEQITTRRNNSNKNINSDSSWRLDNKKDNE